MSILIPERAHAVSDAEYFAMVEAGVFGDRRVFLWGGRLREKMAKSNAHAFLAARVNIAVAAILPPGWLTWHENPIRLGDRDVPLPDFCIIRGPVERYRNSTPGPREVGLLVEIAVTSRSVDLGKRAAKYAKAGVACYWVVDAANSLIVEHRGPEVSDGVASYRDVHDRGPGDEVELILDGIAAGRIRLGEVF